MRRTPVAPRRGFDLEAECAGLPGFERHPPKRLEFAHRAGGTSISLMQVELGHLLDGTRRRVVYLDAHLECIVQSNRRGIQIEVGVLHLTVGQAEAEGVQRRALLLPVALGAGSRLV